MQKLSFFLFTFLTHYLTYSQYMPQYDSGMWRQNFGYLGSNKDTYRAQRYSINFTTIFTSIPKVVVGMVSITTEKKQAGALVIVRTISLTSFGFDIIGPVKTGTYKLDFSWMAFNDIYVEVIPRYYEANSNFSFSSKTFTRTVNFYNTNITNPVVTVLVSGFKNDNSDKNFNVTTQNLQTSSSRSFDLKIVQGGSTNLLAIQLYILIYRQNSNILTLPLNSIWNPFPGSGTRVLEMNTTFYSNSFPLIGLALSGFYSKSNALRVQLSNSTLQPQTSTRWFLKMRFETREDTKLYVLRYNLLVVLNISAQLDNCSSTTGSPNFYFPTRTCSECNQPYNPCSTYANFNVSDPTEVAETPMPVDNETDTNTTTGCAIDEFLYWDGNCSTTCLPPYLSRNDTDGAFCDPPCNIDTEFLYWNGTCQTSCPFPYNQVEMYLVPGCQVPCNDSIRYFYQNGSCLSNCSFPNVALNLNDGLYCNFPCSNTSFYYWNNTCQPSCPSPYRQSTIYGGNYCLKPCINPTSYYYNNGTCLSSCPSPFNARNRADGLYCESPCPVSLFSYWNNTCQPSCPGPYRQSNLYGDNYCLKPCISSTSYYFNNGSCLNSCPSPFITRNQSDGLYCDFPCNNDSDFYYWNGTCATTCPSSFIKVLYGGFNFCNFPCNIASSEMLYNNGSCLKTCTAPYITSVSSLGSYCYNPPPYWVVSQSKSDPRVFVLTFSQEMNVSLDDITTGVSFQFESMDSTAYTKTVVQVSSTEYQIQINTNSAIPKQKVSLQLSSNFVNQYSQSLSNLTGSVNIAPLYSQQLMKTVEAIKSTGQAAVTSVGSASIPLVVLSSNPALLYVLINMIQLYYYLIFINVDYPLNLSTLLDLFSIGVFNFLPNIFKAQRVVDLNTQMLGAPPKFEAQEFDSFFLLTGGGNFSTLIAVLFFGGIGYLMFRYLRNLPSLFGIYSHYWFNNLKSILVGVYNALFLNLNIFAFLQLQRATIDTGAHFISTSLAGSIMLFDFMILCHYVEEAKRECTFTNKKIKDVSKSEFKDWSMPAQLFNCIDIVQKFLFSMFLVLLYYYPFRLIIALVIVKSAFIFYLGYYRPFKNPLSNASTGVTEFLYTCAIILVGVMAKMAESPDASEEKKVLIGYMILILGISSFAFTFMLMLCASIVKIPAGLRSLKQMIRKLRGKQKKDKYLDKRKDMIKLGFKRSMIFAEDEKNTVPSLGAL